ncbi:7562_t:CDS:10 [Diversispora eburnea]|uniref:7562_t:CDS:1 n=1 Tax=Diversispora eburnea TaxID=1213867 RepID=A0A9N8ZIK9_9GLOM|nr:7562_t:CDS:10 [Diversispora eburnea]
MNTSENIKELRPIKKLQDAVINRIAAGENPDYIKIIHRPANAIKELIENSLDAGATNIRILVKEGGLKLLQIQDNGHGIRREDMDIVCERFTTSKLKSFNDLSSINTYGFRGEALASISHVAHVTITTKTADSKSCYSDGKLVSPKPGTSAEPKACAGNTGTQITAEDLFYNVPTRKQALKHPNDEYNRILDIVNRYAIHNSGVGFSCKKQGSKQPDVNSLSTASTLDNIRQIYGSTASELLNLEKVSKKFDFKFNGYISNANFNLRKMTFLLFINHRAVESSALKRTIEGVYETYLPKNSYPFVYLSLEINPQNVDVNIHPTKREVRFLNEDEVIAIIGDAIQERLTLLPGAKVLDTSTKDPESSTKKSGKNPETRIQPENSNIINEISGGTNLKRKRVKNEVKLTSILALRNHCKEVEHKGLTDLLANHTWVGCVDDSIPLALIQHQTKLYMVNYNILCEELFYQLTLQEFSNFAFIRLSKPAPIKELIIFALETNTLISRRNMLLEYFSLTINESGELITLPLILKGYAPNLDKLPTFLLRLGTEVDWETEKGCFEKISREFGSFYAPEPLTFPRDNVEPENIINSIDVENEIPVTMEIRQERNIENTNNQSANQKQITEISKYRWQIEHLIFPILKNNQFFAPKNIAESGHVIQIANLPDLYRIFERC